MHENLRESSSLQRFPVLSLVSLVLQLLRSYTAEFIQSRGQSHEQCHDLQFIAGSDLGVRHLCASSPAFPVVRFPDSVGKLEAIPLPHQVKTLEGKENRNELVHSNLAVVSSCTVALLRVALW